MVSEVGERLWISTCQQTEFFWERLSALAGQCNILGAAMTSCQALEIRRIGLVPAHVQLGRRLLGMAPCVRWAQLRARSIAPPSLRGEKRYIHMKLMYTRNTLVQLSKKEEGKPCYHES